MKAYSLIALVLVLFGVQSARAGTVYTFDSQAVAGQNFSAEGVFTLNNNSLDIVLKNTTSLTLNAGDLLRSVQFTISNPVITAGTLNTATGSNITINPNGTYQSAAGEPNVTVADWILSSGLQLTANMPDNTIIGKPTGGTYAAANNSITGNGPHNPFAFEQVEFTITVNGLTPNSKIGNVIFGFGTASGTTGSNLVPNIVSGPLPAPVYAGLALFGAMGIMLKLGRRNVAC